jgi:fermentation-respiration switch protein FrsA (DUF1100 family)
MFAVCHVRFFLMISLIFFTTGCSHLLYYPMQGHRHNPGQVQLKYEDIQFSDESGNSLSGWWIPASTKEVKGTFIFFHGNAENMSTHFLSMKWLPEQGYNYFIFDYPGYGKSTSGHAAIKWVHKNKDSNPLIIYGNSLGGIVALRAAIDLKKDVPILAFIADDTFSSYRRVARVKLSRHWLTWLFQPLAYVVLSDKWAPDPKDLSPIPLLVIHGDSDNTVETVNGKKLFAEAAEPKEFWLKKDGVHGDTFWRHNFIYRTKVLDWIRSVSQNKK